MKTIKNLNVLAVSAPHWISNGNLDSKFYTFNSQTPFSLQNAIRDAVLSAEKGFSKYWHNSNFKSSKTRNEAVLLMEYWEQDKDKFEKLFEKINPNLLLIGAMTLSFRGAIEIAKYAKRKKGNNIFIVLGGKHANETVFRSRNKKHILNHVASPLTLMQEKAIPHIFDLIVSGDGEKVITVIGNIIGRLLEKKASFDNFNNGSNRLKLEEAHGDWITGQLINNELVYIGSKKNNLIDYTRLAYAIEQFEFKKGFEIFGTDYTVHAYSDNSRGCGYDCFFCSEKGTINGKLRIKDDTSINRLFYQFSVLEKYKKKDYKGKSFSIFIEDSIFLTGRPDFINQFSERCIDSKIHTKFGAQFTLDTFFILKDIEIENLIKVGLDYIAFGIETIDDDIAKTFSKNTDKKTGWKQKIKNVVLRCQKFNLKCGMFLIWGLGEMQDDRKNQLLEILNWIKIYNVPIDIGLNIATQHPLQIVNDTHLDKFGYKKYNYIDWGTDIDDEYLPYFIELFGEASTKYAINKNSLPSITELEELKKIYIEIKQITYSMV